MRSNVLERMTVILERVTEGPSYPFHLCLCAHPSILRNACLLKVMPCNQRPDFPRIQNLDEAETREGTGGGSQRCLLLCAVSKVPCTMEGAGICGKTCWQFSDLNVIPLSVSNNVSMSHSHLCHQIEKLIICY